MKCPRCNSDLQSVEYDGQIVEVCASCKGEWLHAGELQKIVEHHDEVFTPQEIGSLAAVDKQIFTAENEDRDELNCPACQNVPMEHFNYGDTSGIILHKCPQCGGIWMDKDQLQKVEAVVDGWKADLNKDSAQYGGVVKKIDAEEQAELDKAVSISRFGFVNAVLRRFCE
jgi:Zn-finger nucleic acid-binding protein